MQQFQVALVSISFTAAGLAVVDAYKSVQTVTCAWLLSCTACCVAVSALHTNATMGYLYLEHSIQLGWEGGCFACGEAVKSDC